MPPSRVRTLGLLAAAALVGGLAAVDVYLAWNAVRETSRAPGAAEMRTWEPTVLTVRADQLRLPGGRGPVLVAIAQTRCSGDRLYYRLSVGKNPRCCAAARGAGAVPRVAAVLLDLASLDDLLGPIRRFTLRLVDPAGATIRTIGVARRQVYLQPDGAGGIRGGEATADIPWECAAYDRVAGVVVEAVEFGQES